MKTTTNKGAEVPPDMNLTELADYLGVSRETCRRLVVVQRRMPYSRPSPRVVIVKGADAEAFKRSVQTEAAAR